MNMEVKESKAKYQLIKGSSTINQTHVNKGWNDHKYSLKQVRLTLTIRCVKLKGRISQRNHNYSMMDMEGKVG